MKIEAIEPDLAAVGPHRVDDGGHLGQAGHDGRDKTGGGKASFLTGFERRKAPSDGRGCIQLALECVIERVD